MEEVICPKADVKSVWRPQSCKYRRRGSISKAFGMKRAHPHRDPANSASSTGSNSCEAWSGNGVNFIDATAPEAAIAALRSLDLANRADRRRGRKILPFDDLAREIRPTRKGGGAAEGTGDTEAEPSSR